MRLICDEPRPKQRKEKCRTVFNPEKTHMKPFQVDDQWYAYCTSHIRATKHKQCNGGNDG